MQSSEQGDARQLCPSCHGLQPHLLCGSLSPGSKWVLGTGEAALSLTLPESTKTTLGSLPHSFSAPIFYPTGPVDSGVTQTPRYLIKARGQQEWYWDAPLSLAKPTTTQGILVPTGPKSGPSVLLWVLWNCKELKATSWINSQQNSLVTPALSWTWAPWSWRTWPCTSVPAAWHSPAESPVLWGWNFLPQCGAPSELPDPWEPGDCSGKEKWLGALENSLGLSCHAGRDKRGQEDVFRESEYITRFAPKWPSLSDTGYYQGRGRVCHLLTGGFFFEEERVHLGNKRTW